MANGYIHGFSDQLAKWIPRSMVRVRRTDEFALHRQVSFDGSKQKAVSTRIRKSIIIIINHLDRSTDRK
jgi:hypothetical protein